MATSIAVTLPAPTVVASSSFTVTMLREYVTSTLSDAVLGTYLAAAFSTIEDFLGPLTRKDRLLVGYGDQLMLSREAESITTVVEDAAGYPSTLAADDYELSSSARMLYRLYDGTNPRRAWWGRTDVTYVRTNDVDNQIRVAVALVDLELTTAPGLASQSIGTWSESYRTDKDHAAQRDELLASLVPEECMIF